MPRCHAKAKNSGEQCKKAARIGYAVCKSHGAGTKAKPGGRPAVHGRYSKFLQPDELEDFEAFKQAFDVTEDLAFAATKTYHAAGKVRPEQLSSLLETPSKIAMRRKQILEGVTLKLDVDVHFLKEFVVKVLSYVHDPTDQAALLAYVEGALGATAGE